LIQEFWAGIRETKSGKRSFLPEDIVIKVVRKVRFRNPSDTPPDSFQGRRPAAIVQQLVAQLTAKRILPKAVAKLQTCQFCRSLLQNYQTGEKCSRLLTKAEKS